MFDWVLKTPQGYQSVFESIFSLMKKFYSTTRGGVKSLKIPRKSDDNHRN